MDDGTTQSTARAIWTGVIRLDDLQVPVKLYSAVADHAVHFRLLHRKDRVPVRQQLIHPDTERIVPFSEALRAYTTDSGDLVLLDKQELQAHTPQAAREIEILYFLAAQEIDHRWYDRPYYLGPDGADDAWQALAAALEPVGDASPMVGLARWTMRNKIYNGALRLYQGYPMLMSLHNAEEVVPLEALKAPSGKQLGKQELAMARQLIAMLEAPFEPDEYRDEYRDRLLEFIEGKLKGGKLETPSRKPAAADRDLRDALKASLAGGRGTGRASLRRSA